MDNDRASGDDRPLRSFVGFIWIGDDSGIRLAIEARSVEEARSAVIDEYGEGHRISVWNEGDAQRPRETGSCGNDAWA